jgi:hypothetical protein
MRREFSQTSVSPTASRVCRMHDGFLLTCWDASYWTQTYALPLSRGALLPQTPAGGFTVEADMAKISGALTILVTPCLAPPRGLTRSCARPRSAICSASLFCEQARLGRSAVTSPAMATAVPKPRAVWSRVRKEFRTRNRFLLRRQRSRSSWMTNPTWISISRRPILPS